MTILLGMLTNLLPESGDYRLHWMTQQRTDDKVITLEVSEYQTGHDVAQIHIVINNKQRKAKP